LTQTDTRAPPVPSREVSIWWFAFGYFAAYAPYSAATKAVSKGWIAGMSGPLDGIAILPISVAASTVSMVVFLAVTGWWRVAVKPLGRFSLPLPTPLTFASGLLTASIVATTTLAYTFTGISIVFVMLLMRGGVLILAPIVDAVSRRKTRWFSWVGLALSLASLFVAISNDAGVAISLWAAVDVALYLASYFGRLRWMSRAAKSHDPLANKRYFVEEQLVATPAVLLFLIAAALVGPSLPSDSAAHFGSTLRAGFFEVWATPAWPWVLFIGVCSQLTGVFGGLILLDKRENTFCVPVNRSSSVLAGVVASFLLVALFDHVRPPPANELFGAGMLIVGILVLSLAPLAEKRRARPTV
jgi:hypothetical protein